MAIFRIIIASFLLSVMTVGVVQAQIDNPRIILVSGPLIDPFFSALKKGSDDAARDLGIDYQYATVQTLDNVQAEFARLLDQTIAREPDVLIASNFFPDALTPALKRAANAGIPLIIQDGGYATWREVGAFTYIGYDPVQVGIRSGELMLEAGVRGGLCINHVHLCRGFIDTIVTGGGAGKILTIPVQDSQNPQAVLQAIKGALNADPSLDGILTLGATQTNLAARAANENGHEDGAIKIGGLGISTQVLADIRDGKVMFGTDLQAYAFGYYSIVLAYQKAKYDLMPTEPLFFGPRFVYPPDAQKIIDINEKYTGIRGIN